MPQLPVILEGAGWRASFHACGDRIAHTIGVVVAGRFVPLLASMEGTPDDDWPPSPPLTTIDVPAKSGGGSATHPTTTTTAALLVGMAGRSHWSLSVELDAQAWRITFDAAVRLKELPARLGSAYRTMVAA
ncbi:MAG: hypothetical protein K8T25_07045, partial [Planctomycetia bacterium]|nr:hypothetical protein [Planctomycetia bacterium]